MILSIFGGSAPQDGSKDYQQAYDLGKIAANAGWTVATGGYIGVMEAASRGAYDAGGHVIGVTCEEIEFFRPIGKNPWVTEERKFETLRERLGHLIECCDAAIALPGGVGTLAEISMMWNMLIIKSIPPKKLILVGSGWEKVIRNFIKSTDGFIPEDDLALLTFSSGIENAWSQIVELH